METKIITLNDISTKNINEIINLYKQGYTLDSTCSEGCINEENCVSKGVFSFMLTFALFGLIACMLTPKK